MNDFRIILTSCLALLTLFYCEAALSKDPNYSLVRSHYGISATISESKRHHCFIREIAVIPAKFVWEGHEVSIYECWLEQSGDGGRYLEFKLKIDNQVMMDHKIISREKRIFDFQIVGAENSVSKGYIREFKKVPERYFARYLTNGMTGESVHYLPCGSETLGLVRMRIVTIYWYPSRTTPTDQIIEFDLSEPRS